MCSFLEMIYDVFFSILVCFRIALEEHAHAYIYMHMLIKSTVFDIFIIVYQRLGNDTSLQGCALRAETYPINQSSIYNYGKWTGTSIETTRA